MYHLEKIIIQPYACFSSKFNAVKNGLLTFYSRGRTTRTEIQQIIQDSRTTTARVKFLICIFERINLRGDSQYGKLFVAIFNKRIFQFKESILVQFNA